MEVEVDFYVVLGIEPDRCDDVDKEVRRAYLRKARECHPDKNPGDEEANRRFHLLSEAYATLSDPVERARYDLRRRKPSQPSFASGGSADSSFDARSLRSSTPSLDGALTMTTMTISLEHLFFNRGAPFGSSGVNDPFGGFFRNASASSFPSGSGQQETVTKSVTVRDGRRITTITRTVVKDGVTRKHVTEVEEQEQPLLK